MYEKELSIARKTAQEAGRVLLAGFSEEDKGEERKGLIDPVTKYDKLSEDIVISRLHDAFPDDIIMSEESSADAPPGARRWIIDPLDGTVNFSHNYPWWCVSIGLEVDGEDVVGVVFAPCTDEMFSASKEGGAWLNGEKISVSNREKLLDSLTATGFPYSNETYRKTNVENVGKVLGNCMGVRRDGSAALDLCSVACGRLDAFWELGLKPWDTAAGDVILQEAGGKITDFHGAKFNPHKGNIVSSNGKIHNEITALISDG